MPDRSPTAAVAPPLGRLYEAGGRRLMLHRSGQGGPAVVFLPGSALVGLDYVNIHERVAELTTSVLYDRAGTGWSEPADLPRTAAEVTGELHDLLRTAGVPAPYVLAGHSLGGAYARHFAQRFPGEVAGLLLLDPFHEDMAARAPRQVLEMLEQMKNQELPEATEEQIEASRGPVEEHFKTWPERVRRPLVEYHLAAWRTGWYEGRNLYDEVAGELRNAPELPDVPLIVLSAMGHDATQAHLWPEELLREINDGKRALHAELAASVPRGEHRVLEDAGHGWAHEERPDAVLQAITELLVTARH
ncbi:alpha/beta hydrolase [Actinoallomurus bryophytorum]|uniref:Pimeloyl-ACP methyl ester carboxylesterase n=1 Tax=Actinoallomurus bryophytorum TaxID=1490222 RepID=A0A543CMB4_9ACTN|nr:alpha/beta hydrolase [Actinoallomurus bryophytorum]TQL98241.1 pimeloyl-ACP methyl ester carboxylesterase [Actinoallomurus bryophytorum]